jgi:sugar phosphate isomerase/epimerase
MRFGGPVEGTFDDPGTWVEAHRRLGFSAAYCPVGPEADADACRAWEQAARDAGLVIAEVGAWSNPISPDEATRAAALEKCKAGLALADRIGARCCVNIAGSRGARWDGPDPANATDETFDLIVETVREILDAVRPTRTYYTLETMPWVPPDSPESYERLVAAIDRKRFAVHLDPVNLVNSPRRFYDTAALLEECFRRLGAKIRSCHAKDIALADKLTVHLDEVRPGLGGLDYRTFLRELAKLEPDVPLMMEHLPSAAEYAEAARYIRAEAEAAGVGFV